MTNWNKVVFEYICPSIGILISTALYSAPVKVSTQVRYEQRLNCGGTKEERKKSELL